VLVCFFVDFADNVLYLVVGEEHFEGLDLAAQLGDFGVHLCQEVFLLLLDFRDGCDDFVVETVAGHFRDFACFVQFV